MRGAADRVLRDPVLREEAAGHAVRVFPGRRHVLPPARKRFQKRLIRDHGPDLFLRPENAGEIQPQQRLGRPHAEGPRHLLRYRNLGKLEGRKIHLVAAVLPDDAQLTALAVKEDGVRLRLRVIQDDEG